MPRERGGVALKQSVKEERDVKARTQTKPQEVPAATMPFGICYRVDKAADLLGMGRTKIWSLVWEKRIPAHKIDGATVILHDDLVEFVRSCPRFEPANSPQ